MFSQAISSWLAVDLWLAMPHSFERVSAAVRSGLTALRWSLKTNVPVQRRDVPGWGNWEPLHGTLATSWSSACVLLTGILTPLLLLGRVRALGERTLQGVSVISSSPLCRTATGRAAWASWTPGRGRFLEDTSRDDGVNEGSARS